MINLTRQSDIIPETILGQPIKVIGAGAVGSCAIMALTKIGFRDIEVWDDDKVSPENIPNQFFREEDIGVSKVIALQKIIKSFTGTTIKANDKRYENGLLSGIVISAVDSMSVRKNIWMQQKEKSIGCKAIIDPRMGAEVALCYVTNPMSLSDVESYRKTLYTDDEAVQEACTAKATMYTALMLGGLVAKAVKDICVNGSTFKTVEWSIRDNDFVCHTGEPMPKVERENRFARVMGGMWLPETIEEPSFVDESIVD